MAQGETQKGESEIAQEVKYIQGDGKEVASMFPST